ncbi:MAG TPA: OsmC family protein [Bryobacteraceae bacterium]|jgi:osmotically inducible protein OsmC|nr:OsmC family protein [Bryobacteraceae bacterium]
MDRKAKAQWKGDLKSGTGTISSTSGVLSNTPYSFRDRFEDGKNTNPEELLAAAHAACFSMALSHGLQQANLKADSIDTTCTITLDKEGEGFAIKKSHLDLTARIPGADQAAFERAAQAAKENCPVSKLYDTEITLTAKLLS